MAMVIRVRFKRAAKLYDFDPNGLELHNGMSVVTETARGVELGECMSGVMDVPDERLVLPLKPILRIATEQDLAMQKRNEQAEKEAFDIAIDRIAEHKLEMKLVDVEYAFDRSKIIFYFTANGRVDFRMLVKSLASIFKTRIELRQIGVRDMGAQMFGGFFRRDGYSILNYNFGVFNGEGLNVKDKNKSKDIVARFTVKPVAGLQFAGSYYWGEYGEDYLKRIRYGAGACYDYGRLVLRGEYICGTTGGLDSEGWYAVAGWRVARTLLPTVRYDTFLEDCSRGSSRQTNYTAGLTWQPVKYLRCQLDYTYEDFAARDVAGRNVVALMLSGIF